MLRRLLPIILLLPACRNTGGDSPDAAARTTPSVTTTAASPSKPAASQEQELTPVLSDFCFTGTLGDGAISGVLRGVGDQINGEYLPAKGGAKVKLSGSRSGGIVKVEGQVSKGNVTGSFEGSVDGNGHYKGTWSNPGGSKKLPFDLSPMGCGPEYW